ncbi:hypothetical protein HYN48_09140 [Flavobacterium magnum]|uniref:Signal transduction histidine kinase internal region domain-containing protein n=2 Tax=Flavobacterium magnum TaxID=2162713 RepID=A0A2S0RHN3_9FLAO|nr:hypothetical protein HYN48_09140 [Flavobacterium magnum]
MCWSLCCFSQQDDLLQKIRNYRRQDTVRVELLIDYCVNNTFSVSDTMLRYAREAHQTAVRLHYRLGEMRALNCIGNYYYQQGILDKAIGYYTTAGRIAERNKDAENIIICNNNLANIYTQTNQPAKALPLFLESDALLLQTGNAESQNRAAVLTNIGAAYSAMGQHQNALQYHFKVLALCKKKEILFGIAIAQSNIGDEYVQLKKFEKALPFLISAMSISEKNSFDALLGQIYNDLAKVYLARKQFDRAIEILQKGVVVCTRINDQNSLREIHKVLHQAYAGRGDFKKAYLSSLDYLTVNEKLTDLEKQKLTRETSAKYDTEKKEATIKDLNQRRKISELQSNRKSILMNGMIISFIALALVAYFLFSRFRQRKKNEWLAAKLEEAQNLLEAEKKITDSELKALKSQMNPHFIFNALNGIQEQFMYGDKLKANEQLSNFTYLTRQILEVSGRKQISVALEMELLTKYLELEKMRFASDFSYSVSASDAIDPDYHTVPPMILQPFVENSIKHGLLHKQGARKITVYFDIDPTERYLICSVEDNGVGRERSAAIKASNDLGHNSFSTDSIRQRLELLNQELKLEELVVFHDQISDGDISGTKVVLKIPLS